MQQAKHVKSTNWPTDQKINIKYISLSIRQYIPLIFFQLVRSSAQI
jgi:hypothetical protein